MVVLALPILEAKVILLFDTLAAEYGGFITRRVILAAKSLVIASLPDVAEWATDLVTNGRVADGVRQLRDWIRAEIAENVPWWVRRFVCPIVTMHFVCDWICDNEADLMEKVKAAEAAAVKAIADKASEPAGS